jgi:hypothetical protein
MFQQEVDRTCLRQGDILAGVPFPLLSSERIILIATAAFGMSASAVPTVAPVTHPHRDDPNWVTAQVPVRLGFFAVTSQCCDLQPRHQKIPMPTFALARLIPVPARILSDSQKLASLKQNKDPRARDDPGWINFFYVPSHEVLDNRDWVVDFNQLISIPSSEFPAIMARKVLQMEDRWRVKFKIKLAVSLARLTDEERQAGLEEPWQAVQ